jgi:hypothetical protein
MARNLCSNSAPRSELDHRARDARVRLVRIEQSLAVRVARRGFRLVRLFSWRFNRAPKGGRTQGSLSAPRGGRHAGNRLGVVCRLRRVSAQPGLEDRSGDHCRRGLRSHATPNTNSASAPGTIATHKLTAAIAPAPAQMIDDSASAKVAMREET